MSSDTPHIDATSNPSATKDLREQDLNLIEEKLVVENAANDGQLGVDEENETDRAIAEVERMMKQVDQQIALAQAEKQVKEETPIEDSVVKSSSTKPVKEVEKQMDPKPKKEEKPETKKSEMRTLDIKRMERRAGNLKKQENTDQGDSTVVRRSQSEVQLAAPKVSESVTFQRSSTASSPKDITRQRPRSAGKRLSGGNILGYSVEGKERVARYLRTTYSYEQRFTSPVERMASMSN